MLLLKDALVKSSNGRRVVLELRVIGAQLLKLLDVLLVRASGIASLLDNVSTMHVLLIDRGEILVLFALFEAFK